jgi:hypothetical protein
MSRKGAAPISIGLHVFRRERGRAGFSVVILGLGFVLSLPFLSSVGWGYKGLIETGGNLGNFRSGSGQARLVQYGTTMRMIMANPILGVGPGNWDKHYAEYASDDDPTIDPTSKQPTNVFPSGDWLGIIAERGIIAGVLIIYLCLRAGVLAFIDGNVAIAGAIAVLFILGCVDAVVLRMQPILVLSILPWRMDVAARTESPLMLRLAYVLCATVLLLISSARAVGRALILTPDPVLRMAACQADRGNYAVLSECAHDQYRRGNCESALHFGHRVKSLYVSRHPVDRVIKFCRTITSHK